MHCDPLEKKLKTFYAMDGLSYSNLHNSPQPKKPFLPQKIGKMSSVLTRDDIFRIIDSMLNQKSEQESKQKSEREKQEEQKSEQERADKEAASSQDLTPPLAPDFRAAVRSALQEELRSNAVQQMHPQTSKTVLPKSGALSDGQRAIPSAAVKMTPQDKKSADALKRMRRATERGGSPTASWFVNTAGRIKEAQTGKQPSKTVLHNFFDGKGFGAYAKCSTVDAMDSMAYMLGQVLDEPGLLYEVTHATDYKTSQGLVREALERMEEKNPDLRDEIKETIGTDKQKKKDAVKSEA